LASLNRFISKSA
jgi:ribonuclease HI